MIHIASTPVQPFRDAILPGLSAYLGPFTQHLHITVFVEIVGRLPDELAAELIQLERIIAKSEVIPGGNEKRRVNFCVLLTNRYRFL